MILTNSDGGRSRSEPTEQTESNVLIPMRPCPSLPVQKAQNTLCSYSIRSGSPMICRTCAQVMPVRISLSLCTIRGPLCEHHLPCDEDAQNQGDCGQPDPQLPPTSHRITPA